MSSPKNDSTRCRSTSFTTGFEATTIVPPLVELASHSALKILFARYFGPIFFLILLIILKAEAQLVTPNVTRVSNAPSISGENIFRSGVTIGEYIVFGTSVYATTGRAVAFQLSSSGTLTRVSAASAITGESGFWSAVAIGQYIVFGTWTSPGRAVAFYLIGGTLTRVSAASGITGESNFFGAAAIGQYVIFGTDTAPGIAVVFQLSGGTLTRVSAASGISGENSFWTAAVV